MASHFGRAVLLATCAVSGLSVLLAISAVADDAPATPNIILVLADDLGYADPGAYNPATDSPTPNIDRLAEQGMRFVDAHTPASVCTPSRYAVMTGRYAWRTRLRLGVLRVFSEPLIDAERVTLPEMLRSQGYRTGAIGKWHLGMNVPALDGGFARVEGPQLPRNVDFAGVIQGGPVDHGFDTYFGAQLRRVRAFVRDRHFVGSPHANEANTMFEVDDWDASQAGTRQLAAALEFIDQCHTESPERPFFLYYASQLPHAPYSPADSLAGTPIRGTSAAGPRGDCIRELDVTVGELTRRIDELGLARNTIILVTSDNGAIAAAAGSAASGSTRFRGAKGDVLEGGQRVPFIVRWGDGTPEGSTVAPGAVSHEIIGLQDIIGTLADLLDARLGRVNAEDSDSFLHVLLGESRDIPTREDLVMHSSGGRFAFRRAHWKLVVDLDSVAVGPDPAAPLPVAGQLFDLRSDPGEHRDRSAEYPQLVRSMADSLNERRRAGRSTSRFAARRSTLGMGRPMRLEEQGTAEGRWRSIRGGSGVEDLTPEQQAQREQLLAIGYLGGVVEESRSGVTYHDPDAALDGVNFYSSGHAEEAFLMDMDGEVLHRWTAAFDDLWPDSESKSRVSSTWWRRAHLFDNGDILAVYEGIGMVKLDKDSNIVWARENTAHHDMQVLSNGDIVTLTRSPRLIPEVDATRLTMEDFISVLDSNGNEKLRVSIWESLRNSEYWNALRGQRMVSGDTFHANTVHVLDGSLEDRLPAFREGDVLTSLNAMGVLAVVNMEDGIMSWVRAAPASGQHDPQILENGHLLVFDNRRNATESSVMELDPATGELAWEFRGTELLPFHSKTCGAASRLPNGSTLITESDGGRALEVAEDGRVVWEFYNPARAGDEDQYIATLSEVERLDWAEVDAWLD